MTETPLEERPLPSPSIEAKTGAVTTQQTAVPVPAPALLLPTVALPPAGAEVIVPPCVDAGANFSRACSVETGAPELSRATSLAASEPGGADSTPLLPRAELDRASTAPVPLTVLLLGADAGTTPKTAAGRVDGGASPADTSAAGATFFPTGDKGSGAVDAVPTTAPTAPVAVVPAVVQAAAVPEPAVVPPAVVAPVPAEWEEANTAAQRADVAVGGGWTDASYLPASTMSSVGNCGTEVAAPKPAAQPPKEQKNQCSQTETKVRRSGRLREHETLHDDHQEGATDSDSHSDGDEGQQNASKAPAIGSDEIEPVERSPLNRFVRFNRKLGSGSHKTVYLGYDTDTGKEVAWNVLSIHEMDKNAKKRIQSEINVLKSLQHRRIIAFINAWINKEKNQVCFITERVTGGSLLSYIKRIGAPLKLKVMRTWSRQILEGLNYLHTRQDPIIHRDLKCDNIFINGNVGEVLIGDLGLSTTLKQSCAKSIVGTPDFIAPEIYEEKYDTAVDIYAFGMCLVEMASQGSPYEECTTPGQVYRKVIAGEKPRVLRRIKDEQLRMIVDHCIGKEPSLRPKAGELMEHPWLAENEVDGNQLCELIPLDELPPEVVKAKVMYMEKISEEVPAVQENSAPQAVTGSPPAPVPEHNVAYAVPPQGVSAPVPDQAIAQPPPQGVQGSQAPTVLAATPLQAATPAQQTQVQAVTPAQVVAPAPGGAPLQAAQPMQQVPGPVQQTPAQQAATPMQQAPLPVQQPPAPMQQAPVQQVTSQPEVATPVQQVPAPVQQAPAPVQQVPVQQVPAPVQQVPAPVQAPAPAEQTSVQSVQQAPVQQAPVQPPAAPVQQMSALVSQVAAPVQQAQASVPQLSSPLQFGVVPVQQPVAVAQVVPVQAVAVSATTPVPESAAVAAVSPVQGLPAANQAVTATPVAATSVAAAAPEVVATPVATPVASTSLTVAPVAAVSDIAAVAASEASASTVPGPVQVALQVPPQSVAPPVPVLPQQTAPVVPSQLDPQAATTPLAPATVVPPATVLAAEVAGSTFPARAASPPPPDAALAAARARMVTIAYPAVAVPPPASAPAHPVPVLLPPVSAEGPSLPSQAPPFLPSQPATAAPALVPAAVPLGTSPPNASFTSHSAVSPAAHGGALPVALPLASAATAATATTPLAPEPVPVVAASATAPLAPNPALKHSPVAATAAAVALQVEVPQPTEAAFATPATSPQAAAEVRAPAPTVDTRTPAAWEDRPVPTPESSPTAADVARLAAAAESLSRDWSGTSAAQPGSGPAVTTPALEVAAVAEAVVATATAPPSAGASVEPPQLNQCQPGVTQPASTAAAIGLQPADVVQTAGPAQVATSVQATPAAPVAVPVGSGTLPVTPVGSGTLPVTTAASPPVAVAAQVTAVNSLPLASDRKEGGAVSSASSPGSEGGVSTQIPPTVAQAAAVAMAVPATSLPAHPSAQDQVVVPSTATQGVAPGTSQLVASTQAALPATPVAVTQATVVASQATTPTRLATQPIGASPVSITPSSATPVPATPVGSSPQAPPVLSSPRAGTPVVPVAVVATPAATPAATPVAVAAPVQATPPPVPQASAAMPVPVPTSQVLDQTQLVPPQPAPAAEWVPIVATAQALPVPAEVSQVLVQTLPAAQTPPVPPQTPVAAAQTPPVPLQTPAVPTQVLQTSPVQLAAPQLQPVSATALPAGHTPSAPVTSTTASPTTGADDRQCVQEEVGTVPAAASVAAASHAGQAPALSATAEAAPAQPQAVEVTAAPSTFVEPLQTPRPAVVTAFAVAEEEKVSLDASASSGGSISFADGLCSSASPPPGMAAVSPKLTVTTLEPDGNMPELPREAQESLQGMPVWHVQDGGPERNSIGHFSADLEEEEFREAVVSSGQIVVKEVMMEIRRQHADWKFNVSFDFDSRTDTALMVAKELQDAGIVTRDIPMMDLIRDIEQAIIARCRELAKQRSGQASPLTPQRQPPASPADSGQAGEPLLASAAAVPPLPHADEARVVEVPGPDAVPEASVKAALPGQLTPSTAAAPQEPPRAEAAPVAPQPPNELPAGLPTVQSAQPLVGEPMKLDPLGSKVLELPNLSMDRETSSEAASVVASAGVTNDVTAGTACPLAQPEQDDLLLLGAPLADFSSEGPSQTNIVDGPSDVTPGLVENPAEVPEAEVCRWLTLGWPDRSGQARAEVFRSSSSNSEDVVLIQRSLAYLIPEVQELDFKNSGVWCEATSKALASFQKYHSLPSEVGVNEERFWELLSEEVKKRDEKENMKRAKREEEKKRLKQVRDQRRQLQDRESALRMEQMIGLCQSNLDQRPEQPSGQEVPTGWAQPKAQAVGPPSSAAVTPKPAATVSAGAATPGTAVRTLVPQVQQPQTQTQPQPFVGQGRTHTPPPSVGSRPSSASSSRGPIGSGPPSAAAIAQPAAAQAVGPTTAPAPAPNLAAGNHFQGTLHSSQSASSLQAAAAQQVTGQNCVGSIPRHVAPVAPGSLPVGVPQPVPQPVGVPPSVPQPVPQPVPQSTAFGDCGPAAPQQPPPIASSPQIAAPAATAPAAAPAWALTAQGMPTVQAAPNSAGLGSQQAAAACGSESELLRWPELPKVVPANPVGGSHEELAVLFSSEDTGRGQELTAVFRSQEDCDKATQPPPPAVGAAALQQPPVVGGATGGAQFSPEDLQQPPTIDVQQQRRLEPSGVV